MVCDSQSNTHAHNYAYVQHTQLTLHTRSPLTPSLPPFLRQPEFYDLLNLMISRCCVYLVVFNLEDFALQGEAGRRAEQRCVSYLKFWLSCISERSARGSDATPAPVILVGTHADTVNNVSDGLLFVYLLSLTKYFIISAPAVATYF